MSRNSLIRICVHLYVHSAYHPKRTPTGGTIKSPGVRWAVRSREMKDIGLPAPHHKASGVLAFGDSGSAFKGRGRAVGRRARWG